MTETLVQLNIRRGRGARKLDACPTKHPHKVAADHDGDQATPPSPYWRSLNEWAGNEQFQQFLHREFPAAASEWQDSDPVSRRNFLKLMAASLALAGLNSGCERGPQEKIVPYVLPPELQQPAKTLMFATAMPLGGFGKGLLVQSFAGRPIKVEGNPRHPASLGATDPFAQASVLTLYDPDRSQTILAGGEVNTWAVFLNRLRERLESHKPSGGAGIRILTETVTSPTLADQIRRFLRLYPQARWHQYEPVNRDNITAGTAQAFGRPLNPVYHVGRAACIVSLDANFLYEDPGSLSYARQFIDGRRLRVGAGGPQGVWRETTLDPQDEPKPAAEGEFVANRLYVAESTPTITGAMADNRLRVPPSQVEAVAYALASALKVGAAAAPPPPLAQDVARWVQAVADDLRQMSAQRKGATLVIAGQNQPPSVHALAHAMNVALGSVGTTVAYTQPVEAWPDPARPVNNVASLRELVEDMRRPAGDPSSVHTLFIIGGNPGYSAPADINFGEQLLAFSSRRQSTEPGRPPGPLASFSVHLGLYYDETSFNCMWHVPQAHFLEAWGDVRSYGGDASIIQPLISPLYAGRSAHELLSAMLGEPDTSGYEALRRYWRGQRPGQSQGQSQQQQQQQQTESLAPADPAFEAFWERSLRDGIVEGTALPPVQVALQASLRIPPPSRPGPTGLEVSFRPDPSVWDGQFANNGWLQELPKPLTKLTWDNAVYVSKATAEKYGVLVGVHDKASLVNLRYRDRTLTNVPMWVWPGHPDGSVTIHLGYGRNRAGRVGGLAGETPSRGFNAYALLTSDAPTFDSGLEIEVTRATARLACTQDHQSIEGRDIARVHTVADLIANLPAHPPDKSSTAAERGHGESEHVSLYPEYDYSKQHAWGMTVDMNACIGCNACTVACQAENNIAVVGPDQVLNGREMHWIRIDTYYRGDPDDNPEAVFQPMLCQHCEKAPCEVVCPVAATTHSHEGLNEMTYNRCVGTRYCSNNCPYKVRRFNFLQYQDKTTPVLKLMRNPSVTVRDRGVMEKCTYCVQRLNGTRIEVEKLKAQASEATTDAERQDKQRQIHALMGRLQTACQQSCPTEAIVFGDLNYIDEQGRKAWVTRLKEQPIHYGVLTELNTQPRTTYLPRLLNPNPAIRGRPETDPPGRRPPGKEARAGA